MSFEQNVKDIKSVYYHLSGKDSPDVHLTYKGTSHGISKPWNLKIDIKEINSESFERAAEELLLSLKQELSAKISSMEQQAAQYRRALGSFDN